MDRDVECSICLLIGVGLGMFIMYCLHYYSVKDRDKSKKTVLDRRDTAHLLTATIFACIIIIGSMFIGWPIILFLIPSLPPLVLSVYISIKNVNEVKSKERG